MSQTIAPDVGHSALEVTGIDSAARAYSGFWPERDSGIGRVTQLWKHRQARKPTSYSQERRPQQGYMQRDTDHADEVIGLDEDMVVRLWKNLRHSECDFLKWNCASVCKLLVLGSTPTRDVSIKDFALDVSELARLNDPLASAIPRNCAVWPRHTPPQTTLRHCCLFSRFWNPGDA